MSALEQEIIEKIRNLDEAQQLRLLQIVEDMQPKQFDFAEWIKNMEALHEELRADNQLVDVQSLLDEIREEASWPRW